MSKVYHVLMTNKPRQIGTAAETAVVRHLARNGWPFAERRALHGNQDRGDITGTPSLCWEVKAGRAAHGASDGQVETWLSELDAVRERVHADVGILVVARSGYGPLRAEHWWAISRSWQLRIQGPTITVRTTLGEMCDHLRHRGYGNRLEGDS